VIKGDLTLVFIDLAAYTIHSIRHPYNKLINKLELLLIID